MNVFSATVTTFLLASTPEHPARQVAEVTLVQVVEHSTSMALAQPTHDLVSELLGVGRSSKVCRPVGSIGKGCLDGQGEPP